MCFTKNDLKLLELKKELNLKQEIALQDERLEAATLAVLNKFEIFFHDCNLHRMHIGTSIAEILEQLGFPMPLEITPVSSVNNTFTIQHKGEKLCRLYLKPFHMCFLTDNGTYTYFIDKNQICLKQYEDAGVQITLKSLSTDKVIFQYRDDFWAFELFVSIPSSMDPSCLWQKLIQYVRKLRAGNLQQFQQYMENILNSCFTSYVAKITWEQEEQYCSIAIERLSHRVDFRKTKNPIKIAFPMKNNLPMQIEDEAMITIRNWLNLVDYCCIIPQYHFYQIMKLIGFEDGFSIQNFTSTFGVFGMELHTHDGCMFLLELSSEKLKIFSENISLCFAILQHIGRGKNQFVQYKLILANEKWQTVDKSMTFHFHADYKAAPKGREVSCILLNTKNLQLKHLDVFRLAELQNAIWNAPDFEKDSLEPILEEYGCILKKTSKF